MVGQTFWTKLTDALEVPKLQVLPFSTLSSSAVQGSKQTDPYTSHLILFIYDHFISSTVF
jgi:hypothetical protein